MRTPIRKTAAIAAAAPATLALLAACTPSPAPPAFGPPGESHSGPGYTVTVDPADPLRLRARLDLPAYTGGPRTAFVRGTSLGPGAQVRAPACDGEALAAVGDHAWTLPADCRRLSWTIEARPAVANAEDAAAQASLHFPEPGWWLLSEPSALLRVEGALSQTDLPLAIEGLAEGHVVLGGRRQGAGWRVPSVDHAPEFFVFGALQQRHGTVGTVEVTHVVDDVARFERLPLVDLHAQALAYLAEVFQVPAELPEEDRRLLVVWLGIDESGGEAGGAAGSRSFLANYVDGDADGIALNAARTLLVLAHEQVHQLHDLMWRGGAPLPTWMGEGLAHYYGLKALARSDLPPDVVDRAMQAYIDPARPIEASLVEYQRRYASGDMEAYEMFYFQGATLWSEVDRLLREAAPEAGGLDALVPEIMQLHGSGDGMPEALQARLLALGGEPMAELLARMVGG